KGQGHSCRVRVWRQAASDFPARSDGSALLCLAAQGEIPAMVLLAWFSERTRVVCAPRQCRMSTMSVSIIAALFGALVGVILGLTGAGGAIIAVPLLVFSLQLRVTEAAPIALFAVSISAAIGALLALKHGRVRYRAAASSLCPHSKKPRVFTCGASCPLPSR